MLAHWCLVPLPLFLAEPQSHEKVWNIYQLSMLRRLLVGGGWVISFGMAASSGVGLGPPGRSARVVVGHTFGAQSGGGLGVPGDSWGVGVRHPGLSQSVGAC